MLLLVSELLLIVGHPKPNFDGNECPTRQKKSHGPGMQNEIFETQKWHSDDVWSRSPAIHTACYVLAQKC